MSDLLMQYKANAERAMAEAEAATLDNVRDRNLRSAAAWNEMATRVERTSAARAVREAAASAAAQARDEAATLQD